MKPIEVTLKYTWVFADEDCLPPDLKNGWRKSQVKYLMEDIATNIQEYIGSAAIVYQHLKAKGEKKHEYV